MKLRSCNYESELSSALRNGTWPHACGADLQAHVASCHDCRDLVLITESLRHARAESMLAAPLPSPGLLWWKAQLRRRNAALERMNESMALTGRIALVCTLVSGIALGILNAPELSGWVQWFSAPPLTGSMVPVFAALVAVALFGGVAVYLLAYKE